MKCEVTIDWRKSKFDFLPLKNSNAFFFEHFQKVFKKKLFKGMQPNAHVSYEHLNLQQRSSDSLCIVGKQHALTIAFERMFEERKRLNLLTNTGIDDFIMFCETALYKAIPFALPGRTKTICVPQRFTKCFETYVAQAHDKFR